MAWTPAGNIKGPQGIAGPAGTPGSTWYSASGVPSTGTGIVGDYYLNTANGDYYKKTGTSTWTLQANLTGPQGIQGIQGIQGATGATGPAGAPGAKWYTGVGVPSSATGIIGDFYLNTSATSGGGDYYEKTGSAVWTLRGNLTGPQGIQGPAGPGTVTTFSAGNLSPLFNSSVANPTTTPALTFALLSAAAGTVFANTGATSAPPSFVQLTVDDLKTTTTNDAAAAGEVGQYIELKKASGAAITLTNNVIANAFTISLTAGDWDVFGNAVFNSSGTSLSRQATIGTASATIADDGYQSSNYQTTSAAANNPVALPTRRISLASTTTIYMCVACNFTSGTCNVYGFLAARRVR